MALSWWDNIRIDDEIEENKNILVDEYVNSAYKQLVDRFELPSSDIYYSPSPFSGWAHVEWNPDGTLKGGENDMQNTSNFKVGDKLRLLKNSAGECFACGCGNLRDEIEEGTVTYITVENIDSDGYIGLWTGYDDQDNKTMSKCCSVHAQYFERITSARSFMQTLNILAKKLLDADTKALVKAGVLDDCLKVKDTEFILSFLVNQYKKELAAEARASLKEQEDQTSAKA